MSGDWLSVTSTGIEPTPLGKAVVESPSFAGRAPMPPMPTLIALKRVAFAGASGSSGPPDIASTQMLPAPSAGTLPPSGSSRQPNISSGSIWPMTWRAVTARGRSGLTIESRGATTSTTASEPALFGTSGATAHFTPNIEYASV